MLPFQMFWDKVNKDHEDVVAEALNEKSEGEDYNQEDSSSLWKEKSYG